MDPRVENCFLFRWTIRWIESLFLMFSLFLFFLNLDDGSNLAYGIMNFSNSKLASVDTCDSFVISMDDTTNLHLRERKTNIFNDFSFLYADF